MSSHPNYVKKQVAVDTVSWTPVVAPIDCMGLNLKNSVSVDLKTRTDSGDPATQDLIPAGSNEGIITAKHAGNVQEDNRPGRFLTGETIIFCQAASGTGPVLATFVK